MNNRIIVIHRSEIVRQGLTVVLRELFDMDTVQLSDVAMLKNYADGSELQIILLVDANMGEDQIAETISQIAYPERIKSIYLRESAEQSCKTNCDCCFPIEASKSDLYDLLNPFIKRNKKYNTKQNSVGLTSRETEVVKRVALGKTNKEIADELSISFHTVISHRKNITEKLGIKSISGLTVYAILNKLIDANTIDPDYLI